MDDKIEMTKEKVLILREKDIKEERVLEDSNAISLNRIYEPEIELVLPPSLANHDDYQVIPIRNSHRTEIGIPKKSLAVVVEESIKRGDLVALTYIENDAIICCVYDYFAGIVSISRLNSETQLFATEAVMIGGKIIGVGNPETGKDNKTHIRPVDI